MSAKLQSKHLSRRAVVYVRQSSLAQVQGNLESQRRQYALGERARELGFVDVETIDEDLGRSAGGTQARPGFERLLGWVCAGEVGAIFCLEASRLARNGRDWHHLLDLCALTETLIIDPDGTYDPRDSNDRFVLGLKGSVSDYELSLLRQRSQAAIEQKAKRGELRFILPIGLEWTRDDRIVLDPDLRVQEALRLVFKKFTELGSVRRVLLWFLRNKLELPHAKRGANYATHVLWRKPRYATVACILKNPLYAGAYAFGKSQAKTTIIDGRARKSYGYLKPPEVWTVLIPEHHVGYIPWSEYIRNQQMISEHAHRRQTADRKAGRGGAALLSGIVRCHRCGKRMQVQYRGPQGTHWSYVCFRGMQREGEPRCLSMGGYVVDQHVRTELLRALAPFAIEAALLAAKQQQQACADGLRAVELELEQARYQVELSARRYEEVDPSNRLVAVELERRWEETLARAADVERRLEELRQRPSEETLPGKEQLLALAKDLPAVWNAPSTDMALKQRLCRVLVQEVLCDRDRDRNEIVLVIHWQGGQHSELRFPAPAHGKTRRCTPAAAEELLAQLGGKVPAKELAKLLNQRGLKTGSGLPWTAPRVRGYLTFHRLDGSQQPQAVGIKLGADDEPLFEHARSRHEQK